jgi:O-antigen ligase
MISDFWLTGVGPGAYQRGFTAYKDSALRPLFYDHAHNDYLQLLGEYGAIGALIMTIIVGVVLVRLIRAFTKRGDIVVRGALFASLTGVTAMMIHSLVEFNFQIPANALYFWVLVGVGIAATRVKRAKVRRRSDRRPAADGAGTR